MISVRPMTSTKRLSGIEVRVCGSARHWNHEASISAVGTCPNTSSNSDDSSTSRTGSPRHVSVTSVKTSSRGASDPITSRSMSCSITIGASSPSSPSRRAPAAGTAPG